MLDSFIDVPHWKNDAYPYTVNITNIFFELVFTDVKTGKILDANPLCVLNKEVDSDRAKIVMDAPDRVSAYFEMCAEILYDMAKRDIPKQLTKWKWAENRCKRLLSKWQRLIDAGEVKFEFSITEFTTKEERFRQLR